MAITRAQQAKQMLAQGGIGFTIGKDFKVKILVKTWVRKKVEI